MINYHSRYADWKLGVGVSRLVFNTGLARVHDLRKFKYLNYEL